MSNGPACKAGVPQALQQAGDISGDPFEISTIRREVSCQLCVYIILGKYVHSK